MYCTIDRIRVAVSQLDKTGTLDTKISLSEKVIMYVTFPTIALFLMTFFFNELFTEDKMYFLYK